MNSVGCIIFTILFFGCSFGVGYCCATVKLCRNMEDILKLVDSEKNNEFIEGVLFVSRKFYERVGGNRKC